MGAGIAQGNPASHYHPHTHPQPGYTAAGIAGFYLVSRGATTPWRLAMRTPSFNNVSALPAILPGTRVQDLPAVLASMFFVVGDIDR